jgi:hypothetical protein
VDIMTALKASIEAKKKPMEKATGTSSKEKQANRDAAKRKVG